MEQAYQVIARRWRPKQFDELVGQDHIVQTLRNAIESKRIAHAYLFVGPRGTGKTSSARLFAKSLNAEGGPSVAPDNDSDISQAIMNGSCMDVIEIDGASNNSVDQVRELREDCQYAPTQCSYKIYIIDEVHMLSTAAFNALLKTLEEPPPHVVFIFATTESHKVLPTIVSRCQRFEFRPISDEVIVEKLATIAKAEGIKVAPEALAAVARLANGGMRDSQSILDQMISFCGKEIAEQDVLDVYGLVSAERITQLAGALGTLDFAAIIAAVDTFVSEGRDLYRILVDLEAEVRRALLDAIQNSGSTDKLGASLTTESLMRMLDALHEGGASVQRGLSEKVNFEVVLLKAAEESRSRAIDTVLKQLAGSGGVASADSADEKKKLNLRDLNLPPLVVPGAEPVKIEESVVVAEAVAEEANDYADSAPVAVSDAPEPQFEVATPVVNEAPLMTIEAAVNKIGEEVLNNLKEQFNGKPAEMRHIDHKDRIFESEK